MVIPHVGGRHADVKKYFDPEIEHCVEILSCHGIFEWLLWDALEMGHQVDVVCNSDGHKGRPGAEGPGTGQFGIHGGLTCVLAEDLSREALFNAIKSRRCYGTTGARIHLEFTINGHHMGEVFSTSKIVDVYANSSWHSATGKTRSDVWTRAPLYHPTEKFCRYPSISPNKNQLGRSKDTWQSQKSDMGWKSTTGC